MVSSNQITDSSDMASILIFHNLRRIKAGFELWHVLSIKNKSILLELILYWYIYTLRKFLHVRIIKFNVVSYDFTIMHCFPVLLLLYILIVRWYDISIYMDSFVRLKMEVRDDVYLTNIKINIVVIDGWDRNLCSNE